MSSCRSQYAKVTMHLVRAKEESTRISMIAGRVCYNSASSQLEHTRFSSSSSKEPDLVRGMLLICSGERCRVNGKKCRAMPADKSVTKDRFGDFGFSYEPRFWLWGDDFGRRSLAMVVVEGQFSMFQNCSSWLSELCGKSSRSSHPFVDNLNR